jgi:hypothetical protein|tara:strand:+ start:55 stop:510 length:456 start_codon:yes stop_codon:yes gene_type:complete
MATEILIANGERIILDQSDSSNSFQINWADKGNAFPNIGDNIHYVIYNNISGHNEVQTKDPTSQMMTGNTDLTSTSSVVGNSVTVSDLLTWGETRKNQIKSAQIDLENYTENALTSWTDAGNNANDFNPDNAATDSFIDWSRTWIYYDSNY